MTPPRTPLSVLEQGVPFEQRHIGPDREAQAKMLAQVGYGSLDELTAAAVPDAIKNVAALDLPGARSEAQVLAELRELAGRNQVLGSMIGLGYYGTFTPPVILRNVMENPAWYTAYTPYQPEISQGRLEALLNFQTMVADLTGLPTSGASLLDEGTAAAEAMALSLRMGKNKKGLFLVDADAFPQTVAVIRTRAEPTGVEVVVADLSDGIPAEVAGREINGVLIQYPGASGVVRDIKPLVEQAHAVGALVTVAADLLALTLLTSPGELGADIAVGTTQRFGVPMGFGGPHAGYMAVHEKFARSLPGRLVGVSVDADGNRAYRLALQTREQHIRREKATSNICTAQVLLAVMAGMYAVYHGPDGLRQIAWKTHRYATVLAEGLRIGGVDVVHQAYFDTVLARVPGGAAQVVDAARDGGVNLRLVDGDHVSIACDETTTRAQLDIVWQAFGVSGDVDSFDASAREGLGDEVLRRDEVLSHPVFHQHRSETAMLRYLRRLADRDYALDRGMIPLGSCTMKLNATTEMEPVTWPEFGQLHPFAPVEQAGGYLTLIRELEDQLAEVTGYDKVSLQPNAGSQGELAGLLAVRAYHRANGDLQRTVCLIPSSAHGTNAASAVMAGMKVVVVKTSEDGEVDVEDLRGKIGQYRDELAVLMITYPSTHGVFEEHVGEICGLVHEAGGQVYVDGANLNALVGVAKPGHFGGDVSHLNLHKTFCIPHGGGGPGVGPVAVRAHLAPYLPNHPLQSEAGPATGVGPVSAAPWGSAGILPISWAYVRLMGGEGLKRATQVAVLSANYIAKRLEPHYPVLYTGPGGLVAHECIIDLRPLTKATGVSVDDVAKRLIDYGFHAPTMSFPVAGTLMIEPTESEDLAELDRFCAAMIAIRGEIEKVGAGEWGVDDNPLRNAPHTAAALSGEWAHSYTREEAVFPGEGAVSEKYWPPVRRIDQAYGDRNLVCSCPPLESYQ
ncbi:aminomethyl-transferring glycine dehydrogenase [Streptomyces acidiscabies]|uniref:Glycine dehydrogenase (decarboxylating) n=1 Tax=Streptomyces acidiscabies TaxID=42234 RepID=A0AAP6BL96_9ACTN|nr:aminomethyl-transferring glycine dehydrogenase [Streptomyces acidiscabies]MBZ3912195.1 aminomethyl-transferring glycine dehydrogenase [Streptomyces acidiscabies]MDX2966808.1 aminomethyl-transferring glycine dehydrogenase [Streptomyces acidiscabies]MDX3024735.1 aminomethyl-transferring glycine dehydrogenase [Streptomyces acidiscabies]MDX3796778.1 aminomethyl-transferring glycine dehydrogenase [Streptomyces acidiscabies]GAQ58537.1 glycine dehydrogenase [Streptomyces acidiscabies]